MIIKKFQGRTEAEAVENAKKELGSGVVVMNVRSVKKSGFFSFLRPQLTEVTVALEEESERLPAQRREEPLESRTLFQGKEETLKEKEAEKQNLQERTGTEDSSQEKAIEEKLDNLHFLLEQQLKKGGEESEEKQEEKETELQRFMKLVYQTMLDNEVRENYANQIIDEMEKVNHPNMPFDYALANVYQKMILKFGQPREITPAAKGPKVLFFIGPTGVGKTTTIAKIASRLQIDEQRKVALFTADTYRIAAAEQLRTYANILEVPFRVIYSPEEMEKAVSCFQEYDFILVDTAGHSYQNEEQKESIRRFLDSVSTQAEKEIFLVLSATTKLKDLLSIVDSYSEFTDYKLIFTKLDETTTLGNILNVRMHTGAELSYVTCGQNVPNDIECFNPQKTVKSLLGGGKNQEAGQERHV